MQKLGAALFFLSTFFVNLSIPVKFPSADILSSRLEGIKLGHFVRNNEICQQLGGKKIDSTDALLTIGAAVYDYKIECRHQKKEELENLIMSIGMRSISEAFFKDSPAAIQELQNKGILTTLIKKD